MYVCALDGCPVDMQPSGVRGGEPVQLVPWRCRNPECKNHDPMQQSGGDWYVLAPT